MPQRGRLRQRRRARALKTLTRNSERRSEGVCEVKTSGSGGGSSGVVRMKKGLGGVTMAIQTLSLVSDGDERPEQEENDGEGVITAPAGGDGGGGDAGGGEEEGGGVLQTKRDHKRRRRRRMVGKTEEEEEEGGGGADYPLDLWFLISEHLRPEDVGRFACVCQATHYITTTVRFWLAMFRRHYHWSAKLPDSLNYWNLDHRIRDVRVCVIRALFLMYAPFCVRLAAEKPLSADPTQLLRTQCILQWHQREGRQHKYFFKFAEPQHTGSSGSRHGRLRGGEGGSGAASTPRHNPHSGCWVLEATSVSVCSVAMVMGEYLYHAGLGVSANLCSHCLRLSLVPSHLLPPSAKTPTRRHQVPATEITLDPVSNVRVYPWWHPRYWNLLETSRPSATTTTTTAAARDYW